MKACEITNPDGARPTVLVIDDERGPRESLRYLLKNDYTVLCTESVDEGLKLIRGQSLDAVILDIRMPGRDGIDGLREIRTIDTDLAVIMLTGFAAVGTAQEAIRHEASDYMEKPFDAADMRRAVGHHVEQTRLRRRRSRILSEAEVLNRRIDEFQEKDRLAELGQTSAEFVHDLRNALTGVTGSSSMLREEVEDLVQHAKTPSEAGYYLDSLERSMRHCVEMLDTWQRLIGQSTALQTRFHLRSLVQACVDTCKPAAQAAHAHMTCESCGDDVELQADRVQLTRVLVNLIQNAVHALPADHGWIRVRSEALATTVRITITDNGCGITEENLGHIFSANFSTRRKLGGMGLGLFIAQKVAQAHGGCVTVESVVNQGSTFTITLPRVTPLTNGSRDGTAAE